MADHLGAGIGADAPVGLEPLPLRLLLLGRPGAAEGQLDDRDNLVPGVAYLVPRVAEGADVECHLTGLEASGGGVMRPAYQSRPTRPSQLRGRTAVSRGGEPRCVGIRPVPDRDHEGMRMVREDCAHGHRLVEICTPKQHAMEYAIRESEFERTLAPAADFLILSGVRTLNHGTAFDTYD